MQRGMNQTLAWILAVFLSSILFSGLYVIIMRDTGKSSEDSIVSEHGKEELKAEEHGGKVSDHGAKESAHGGKEAHQETVTSEHEGKAEDHAAKSETHGAPAGHGNVHDDPAETPKSTDVAPEGHHKEGAHK